MNYKETKAGDLMHLRECNENDVTYGAISIRLKAGCANLNDAEQLLIAFKKQLQRTFIIQHTTGLNTETFPGSNKTAITDYWQDNENKDWKVKGWTNGSVMAVLYIKNIGAVPVAKEAIFLDRPFFIQV